MTKVALRVALIAHDEKKNALVAWAQRHQAFLRQCELTATGTTGSVLTQACPELRIKCLKSGPLGGDQQMGALITEGGVDLLIFFVDPLSPHPHDVDIKALLRVAILNNIAFACNEETATLLVRALNRTP